MKKLTLSFVFLLSLLSCDRFEDEKPTYTFSGHLYKNCEKEPYANMEGYFYKIQNATFGSKRRELISEIVTNDNGFFNIEHDNKFMDRISAEDKNGNGIFSFPVFNDYFRNNPNKQIDYYSRTRLRHPIKILAEKPFTNQDTLFIEARGNYYPVLALPGPFTNNQVGETDWMSFVRLTYLIAPFASQTSAEVLIYWCIGRENLSVNNTTTPGFIPNRVKVTQRICDGDTILIDMR
jgi:hypothetical protein